MMPNGREDQEMHIEPMVPQPVQPPAAARLEQIYVEGNNLSNKDIE